MFPFGIPHPWRNRFKLAPDLDREINLDPDADIARGGGLQTFDTSAPGMTLAELLGEDDHVR
jgi:hypothetical protein